MQHSVFALGLVLLLLLLAGCTQLTVNPESAVATDTCSQPGSGLSITNQQLTTEGWRLQAVNISGQSLSNFRFSIESTPLVAEEIAWSPSLSLLSDSRQPLSAGRGMDLFSSGNYLSNIHYNTRFSVHYSEGDFERTLSFECSGTAKNP